jgi:AbrB family looped-hinge helix DNA binding protein
MGIYDARTSVKGQTTIPVEVRKVLGLEPGGSVMFVTQDDGQVKIVAKKKGLRHLKGIFGPWEGPPMDVDAAIEETVARRTDPNRTELDP